MKKPTPKRLPTPSHPVWKRWLSFAALLLIAVAGVAQAAHIHGDWLPSNAHTVHANIGDTGLGSEDSCPLCVAMHSALPAALVLAAAAPVVFNVARTEREISVTSTLWHFAMFSRPPPVPALA